MKSTVFAVGDEPYCLWEENVMERTRDFLAGLDTDFFDYLLKVHSEAEDKQRGSVGIRLALHHATETLFSLLGAFIQAPHCPYAWVAQCKTERLREVVRRISDGGPILMSRWPRPPSRWEDVAKGVFRTLEPGSERQATVIDGFARAWSGLAQELQSDTVNDEYNAIKHGFRAQPGGFRLEIGPPGADGMAGAGSPMTLLGESQFGSMFFKIEKVKGKGGRHLRSRRRALNWSVERDVLMLQLCKFSINNVVSALKVENGFAAKDCRFQFLAEGEDYMQAWKHVDGVISVDFDYNLDESKLPEASKEDLLKILKPVN